MPKIVDHDQKREELLTGCFALWAQRGHSAVTMREVAKHLKVSTGTLYHYFQNKEELFVQMVTLLGDRDVTNARTIVREGHDLPQKIGLLLSYVEEELHHFRQLLLIAVDYYRHNPANDEHVLAKVVSSFRETIAEELSLPLPMATLLLSTLFGMITQGMMDPSNVNIHDHRDLLLQIMA